MDRLQRARRLTRSRSGRVPYSLVAIIILASILTLSTYLELVSSYQNLHASYDTPENTQASLLQAEGEIVQAAHFDLLNATAQILSNSPFGTSAQLNLLNSSVNSRFTGSLRSLGLVGGTGLTIGSTTITATSWGVNVTYAQGSVNDTASLVTTNTVSDPYLTALPVANPAAPDALVNATQENLYPMIVGTVSLVAVDFTANSTESASFPFTTTLQSEVGLLESQASQFADSSFGASSSFSRLVTYIATTIAELRALAGYGTGGYPGPHSTTFVSDVTAPSVLSKSDVNNATSLATLLQSLRYFRSFDANAVNSFLSGLPAGAYQTLLDRYVHNGTVDSAALFLLLINSTADPYGIGSVSSGEGIASAVYSFADRYKFDLLQQFWLKNVVDPTLNEPVANWALIDAQSTQYFTNMLDQWLTDYHNWLGVTLTSIPALSYTATIPAEISNAGGCSYTILPAGNITVATSGVANLMDLILGTLANPTLNNGQTLYFAPTAFHLWENVTIDNPSSPYYWQDGGVGNSPEEVGYYVVQRSLLGEYNTDDNFTTLHYVENNTLGQLITDVSNSMGMKSPVMTDETYKGLLDYLAYLADMDGNNYTIAQAGLPDLSTLAGVNTALNDSSYSLLTNGSSTLFAPGGPFAQALQGFAAQAMNPTWVNNSWINGASHPGLLGVDNNFVGPYPWAMSDVARMTAREWFQTIYNLYYATSPSIPHSPAGIIDGNPMDNYQYDVVSKGVQHLPPPGFNEPDFAMNVQNETYISAMAWMGYNDPSGDGQFECGGGFFGNQCGDTATSFNNYYASGGFGCDNSGSPAYAAAVSYWFGNYQTATGTNEEGTGLPSHTWNNIRDAVLNALNGTPTNPGVDSIHPSLVTSWNNVRNNTGDAYWNCGVTGVVCPAVDSGNFTNWILRTIAPPVLNDTRAMGQTGGWLTQLYNSTHRWLLSGANVSGTIYRPMLDNHMPYSFWWGNHTVAAQNAALFSESLQGMMLRTPTSTLSWTPPATTVHMVDPQDDTANMGLAPFVTTWAISVLGDASLELNSTRGSLGSGGALLPTHLNVSIPLNFDANVTIYTPWPMESGTPQPTRPGPTIVETRGLIGFEGNDFGYAPTLLPGAYVSHDLDGFILASADASRIANTEGFTLADLLSGLPDRTVGVSAAWAENLTALESVTNEGLNQTSGNYHAIVQGYLQTVLNQLNAHTGPLWFPPTTLTSHLGAYDAYFGQDFALDLQGQCLAYFNSPTAPANCGTLPARPSSQAFTLGFGGAAASRVTVAMAVDEQFVGTPALMTHGFNSTWKSPAPGTHWLNASWDEMGTPYRMALSSPTFAPTLNLTSRDYGSLAVPFVGPGITAPATLSAYALGCQQRVNPACSAVWAALNRSVLTYPGYATVFEDYVSEELYAAGYLYDNLTGPALANQDGITTLGYATNLAISASHAQNYSISLSDPTGLFGSSAQRTHTLAFLQWFEQNSRALSYDLGSPSTDPTVLSTADPYLLMDAYRNVTFLEGAPTDPTMVSWSSPNLAFTLADLGGASGGLADSPTVEIGGWTPDQGGWGFSGTLTEA